MADDLGFPDLGCYGSEIETPHLDRLAVGGLRFTQFYNTGRCCPTRASLLTGLYAHQTGVGHMEENFGRPEYQGFLNDRCVTIGELLRSQGYQTWMAGKWNVGWQRPQWPVDRGFDRYYGLLRGASNYFAPQEGPRRKISLFALDDQLCTSFGERFYVTDAFSDFAVERIQAAAKQGPFFLYLAYTAPHSPLHAWPEDIARYRGKYRNGWDTQRAARHRRMIDLGVVDGRWPLAPRDPRVPAWADLTAEQQDFEDLKMAVYAAQIDRMDRGIGRVMAAFGEAGVADNTLVMFLSDNGGDGEPEGSTKNVPPGPKESSHIYGHPWAQVSNTPFRGYKHDSLEGGIATPLVVSWPAVIKHSRLSHEPGHVIDLMATCLEVAGAGAAYPQTYQGRAILSLEGKSLAPIFRNGMREGQKAIYWEHEGNRAVREGRWKLVPLHNRPWQLYDINEDRTEQDDLAKRNPDKAAALSTRYDVWAARCGVTPWSEMRRGPNKNQSERIAGR